MKISGHVPRKGFFFNKKTGNMEVVDTRKDKPQYAAWTVEEEGKVNWITSADNKTEARDFCRGLRKDGQNAFYGTITCTPIES